MFDRAIVHPQDCTWKVGARGIASLEGRDSSRLPIWTTSLLAYISLYASVAGVGELEIWSKSNTT
jgi:hypothetical protein